MRYYLMHHFHAGRYDTISRNRTSVHIRLHLHNNCGIHILFIAINKFVLDSSIICFDG